MRFILLLFVGNCLLFVISSCRQSVQGTLDYKTLQYDTNQITIFKWDTTKYSSYNSDALPLQQSDLSIIDSLLSDAIDSFNVKTGQSLYQSFGRSISIDSFTIRPEKYRYQYFPFKDVNGEKIVLITGFTSKIQSRKTQPYIGRLHYGMSKIELKINLTKRSRGDISSGSFG